MGTFFLFNTFINESDGRIQGMLMKSEDDTKLERVASSLEDKLRIENDPDKLESWSEIIKVELSKGKCKELH